MLYYSLGKENERKGKRRLYVYIWQARVSCLVPVAACARYNLENSESRASKAAGESNSTMRPASISATRWYRSTCWSWCMTASTVQSRHSASRTCCIDVAVAGSILSVTRQHQRLHDHDHDRGGQGAGNKPARRLIQQQNPTSTEQRTPQAE